MRYPGGHAHRVSVGSRSPVAGESAHNVTGLQNEGMTADHSSGIPSRLVANISLQFTEIPRLSDRVLAAAEAGFNAVEFWRWEDVDLLALRHASESAGVEIYAFVTDWTVAAADPAQQADLLAAVEGAADAANRLGATRIVVPLGLSIPGQDKDARQETLAAALRLAARTATDRGVALLIEPVNSTVDHPGSALTNTSDALELLALVADPGVRLLFDVYHSATQGEDVCAEIRRAGVWIEYVQLADSPGRHELGTGTIAWAEIAAALRDVAYAGAVGFEFAPSASSAEALRTSGAVWGAAWQDAGGVR